VQERYDYRRACRAIDRVYDTAVERAREAAGSGR
jgi:hypothetical protein